MFCQFHSIRSVWRAHVGDKNRKSKNASDKSQCNICRSAGLMCAECREQINTFAFSSRTSASHVSTCSCLIPFHVKAFLFSVSTSLSWLISVGSALRSVTAVAHAAVTTSVSACVRVCALAAWRFKIIETTYLKKRKMSVLVFNLWCKCHQAMTFWTGSGYLLIGSKRKQKPYSKA